MSVSAVAMWSGQYLNGFMRQVGRDFQRLFRPLKSGAHGYEETPLKEAWQRIRCAVHIPPAFAFGVMATPVALGCFTTAWATSSSRLEIKDEGAKYALQTKRKFNLLSLNVCFQEGFAAPIEGGVVAPFEPAGGHQSRVAAIAHWIAHQTPAPDIVLGQEFSDLYAQDAFVCEMKKYGFCFFILDRAPHPLLYNSGLLVASKYKLGDISFIPFPLKERYLGAKLGQKGALQFSVVDKRNNRLLCLIDTHLNAHSGPKAETARSRQMKHYVLPHFANKERPTVLMGDLNFDTQDSICKRDSGLEPYTNIAEGYVTWTNEGMKQLRDVRTQVVEEKIDAIIANSSRISFSHLKVKKVQIQDALLSDHYALSCTAELQGVVAQFTTEPTDSTLGIFFA